MKEENKSQLIPASDGRSFFHSACISPCKPQDGKTGTCIAHRLHERVCSIWDTAGRPQPAVGMDHVTRRMRLHPHPHAQGERERIQPPVLWGETGTSKTTVQNPGLLLAPLGLTVPTRRRGSRCGAAPPRQAAGRGGSSVPRPRWPEEERVGVLLGWPRFPRGDSGLPFAEAGGGGGRWTRQLCQGRGKTFRPK